MNVTLIMGGDPTHGAKIEIIDKIIYIGFKDFLNSLGISKPLEEILDSKTTINSIPEIIPCAFCSGPSMLTDMKLARLLTLTHINHSLILYYNGKRETYPLCDGCAEITKEIIIDDYKKFINNHAKIQEKQRENASLLQELANKISAVKLEAKRHCPWPEKQPQPVIKVISSQ